MKLSPLCAGIFSLWVGSLQTGTAGMIRNDVEDSFYTSLAQQSVFDCVGFLTWNVGSSAYIASGTLIAPDWVLTAGHVVGGTDEFGAGVSGMTFGIGPAYHGAGIAATEWIPYGAWSQSGGDLWAGVDLGLVRLSQPLTGVTPARMDFSTPLLGLLGTSVGYGRSGTGLTGMSSGPGTKRAGQNVIDARGGDLTTMGSGTLLDLDGISPTVLFYDFDKPGDPVLSSMGSGVPVALEYLIGSGDSGGALFIDVGGVSKLVGVNSFLASLPSPLDTTGPNGDYGDLAGVISVQSFGNWIYSVTGVPEPSSFSLLWLGLGGLLLRRRR